MKKIFVFINIFLVFFLVSCKKDNTYIAEKIEANHEFFNENFISFLKISTTLDKEDNDIYPKYSIIAYMHIVNGTERRITSYQVDWISGEDKYDTYYRNQLNVITPARFIAQQFLPFVRLEGDELHKVKVYYKYRAKIEDIFSVQEFKYEEDILKYSSDDYILLKNELPIDINIYKNESDLTNYRLRFELLFNNGETKKSHIDIQTWIKTTSGNIYPFIGLYNYATYSEDYISISDELIPRIVDIDEIYIKAIDFNRELTYTKVLKYNNIETYKKNEGD